MHFVGEVDHASPASHAQFDCLLDPRSTDYEHWTYNYGMVHSAIKASADNQQIPIRSSASFANLLAQLGIAARARIEWNWGGGRLIRLLMREALAAVEIAAAMLRYRRVMVLHVHPLGVFLTLPILLLLGNRLSICLHNDLVTVIRGKGKEDRLERWLWWAVARAGGDLTFLAPNRHYRRFVRLFFPPGTRLEVIPHPITPREVYEQIASSVKMDLPPEFRVGFFGRVEAGRGIDKFDEHVLANPDDTFVVAGLKAKGFPSRPNVLAFEIPETALYCALIVRTKCMFLDLRSEVYRIGESGVFWDAVALGSTLLCGELPRMYRGRVRDLLEKRTDAGPRESL